MIGRRAFLAGAAVCAAVGPRMALAQGSETVGGVTRFDPALDALIDPTSKPEVLARGIRWAEGPVWVPQGGGYLLFSDPPANIVRRWTAETGAQPFLDPSGLQTPVPPTIREPGANGMVLDAKGRLLLADSGTRALVRVDLKTRKRTILADRYKGKRFNSPNDMAVARSGAIYFTDPPYGLTDADASPLKEQPVNGVYRLSPDGKVVLIDGAHRRPNGIGLSPDNRTLYVALSDETQPEVRAYTLDAAGEPTGQRLFRDMRPQRAQGLPGNPDGMKVAPTGHVFASGPGGIHVCSPEGQLLGIVGTGKAIANCCIGEGGRSLFLASSDMICRIPLKG